MLIPPKMTGFLYLGLRAARWPRRMSGIWGPQSSMDLYLQEEGIDTLFMSGVNTDQVGTIELQGCAILIGEADVSVVRVGYDN